MCMIIPYASRSLFWRDDKQAAAAIEEEQEESSDPSPRHSGWSACASSKANSHIDIAWISAYQRDH